MSLGTAEVAMSTCAQQSEESSGVLSVWRGHCRRRITAVSVRQTQGDTMRAGVLLVERRKAGNATLYRVKLLGECNSGCCRSGVPSYEEWRRTGSVGRRC